MPPPEVKKSGVKTRNEKKTANKNGGSAAAAHFVNAGVAQAQANEQVFGMSNARMEGED